MKELHHQYQQYRNPDTGTIGGKNKHPPLNFFTGMNKKEINSLLLRWINQLKTSEIEKIRLKERYTKKYSYEELYDRYRNARNNTYSAHHQHHRSAV